MSVHCVVTVDKVLHCIMKCTPNNIKATIFRRKGLAGLVACMGRLEIISYVGQEK